MTDTYERCSCGARYKAKCSKESSSGGGKMCVKPIPIPNELFERMDMIKKKAEENKFDELMTEWQTKYPEEMAQAEIDVKEFMDKWREDPSLVEIRDWSIEFAKNQETLPVEFQQILDDNILELYEE